MLPFSRQLSTSDADFILDQLESDGFACLPGAVSAAWLEQARLEVYRRLQRHGQRYFSLVRPSDGPGSIVKSLVEDLSLLQLLDRLTKHSRPSALVDQGLPYNVLRVIAGRNGAANSLEFHYDASVITALVPIMIPKGEPGKSGELVLYPNRRSYRTTIIHNLLEKIVVQSSWFRRRMVADSMLSKHAHVKVLEPGNIYFFWGYRTYHGNLPCDTDTVRATLLLHHGDPHGGSVLLSGIKLLRRFRENWNLARARS